MQKKQIIGGLITNTIIILVISKLATGSLNPWEVFRGNSLFLKIVVGFFCLSMLALLARWLMIIIIGSNEVCARVKPEPGCGKLLMEFAPVLGDPVRCNFCQKWYHKMCFKAGGGTALGGCKQPHCSTGREY